MGEGEEGRKERIGCHSKYIPWVEPEGASYIMAVYSKGLIRPRMRTPPTLEFAKRGRESIHPLAFILKIPSPVMSVTIVGHNYLNFLAGPVIVDKKYICWIHKSIKIFERLSMVHRLRLDVATGLPKL